MRESIRADRVLQRTAAVGASQISRTLTLGGCLEGEHDRATDVLRPHGPFLGYVLGNGGAVFGIRYARGDFGRGRAGLDDGDADAERCHFLAHGLGEGVHRVFARGVATVPRADIAARRGRHDDDVAVAALAHARQDGSREVHGGE